MNTLIPKLKNEISHLDSDIDVHSFYKCTLHPNYLNHNNNFHSKYDDKPAFYPHSDYNGNKYNLERHFDEPVIHYKADNFNLQNTDHKKMMLNNLETENEISNDFNRRTRESESGQTLQEIKNEDDERAENLKKLLDQFNIDINKTNDNMFMNDDRNEIIDEIKKNIEILNNKYHRPRINKAIEDIEFENNINKLKKITKTKSSDILDIKKQFYRQNSKQKKERNKEAKDIINEIVTEKENEIINTNLMNKEDINIKSETMIYNTTLQDDKIMLYSRKILDFNNESKLSKEDVGKINSMLKANDYPKLKKNTTVKTTVEEHLQKVITQPSTPSTSVYSSPVKGIKL